MSGSKDWNNLDEGPGKPPKKQGGKKDLQELMRKRYNRASSAASSSSSNTSPVPRHGASDSQNLPGPGSGAASAFHPIPKPKGAVGGSNRQSPMRDENGNHLGDKCASSPVQEPGKRMSQSTMTSKSASRSTVSRSVASRSSSRAVEDEALNTVLGEVVQEKKPGGNLHLQGGGMMGEVHDDSIDEEMTEDRTGNAEQDPAMQAYNDVKNKIEVNKQKNKGKNEPEERRGGGLGQMVHIGGRQRGGMAGMMNRGGLAEEMAGSPHMSQGQGGQGDLLSQMLGRKESREGGHGQPSKDFNSGVSSGGGKNEVDSRVGGGGMMGQRGGMMGSSNFGNGVPLLQGGGSGLGGGDMELAQLLQGQGRQGGGDLGGFSQSVGGGGRGGGLDGVLQLSGRGGKKVGFAGVPQQGGRGGSRSFAGFPQHGGRGGSFAGFPQQGGRGESFAGFPQQGGRGGSFAGFPQQGGGGGGFAGFPQQGGEQGGVMAEMMKQGGAEGNQEEDEREFNPEKVDQNQILQQLMVYEKVKASNCRDSRSEGMSTLILVDTSASMAGEPIAQAGEFISQFLNGLEEVQFEYGLNENVALGVFGGDVHVAQHLTDNYPLIRRAVDSLLTEGATQLHIGLALIQAVFGRHIYQDRADCIAETNGHHIVPRVILISDGFPTVNVDPPGQPVRPSEETSALQNACAMLIQKLYENVLFKMYCVPVGNAQQEFLNVLSSSTGGQVLQVQDGRRASHCFLHHFLVGQLLRDGLNIHDRGVVSEAVKQVMGMPDDADVNGVMEVIQAGEPDLRAREAMMAKEAEAVQQIQTALQQRGLSQGAAGSEELLQALMASGDGGQALLAQMMAAGGQGEQMGQLMAALGGEEGMSQALMAAQGAGGAQQHSHGGAGPGRGAQVNPALQAQLMGATAGNRSGVPNLMGGMSSAGGRGQKPGNFQGLPGHMMGASAGERGRGQNTGSPQGFAGLMSGFGGGGKGMSRGNAPQFAQSRGAARGGAMAGGRGSIRGKEDPPRPLKEGETIGVNGAIIPPRSSARDGIRIQPNLNLRENHRLDGGEEVQEEPEPEEDAYAKLLEMMAHEGDVEKDPIAAFMARQKENAGKADKGKDNVKDQKAVGSSRKKKKKTKSERDAGKMGEIGGMGWGDSSEDEGQHTEDDQDVSFRSATEEDEEGAVGLEGESKLRMENRRKGNEMKDEEENNQINDNHWSDPNEFSDSSDEDSEGSWSREMVCPGKGQKPITLSKFLFGDAEKVEVTPEVMKDLLTDLLGEKPEKEEGEQEENPEEKAAQPPENEFGGLEGLFQPGFGRAGGRGLGFGLGGRGQERGGDPSQIQGLGAGQNQGQQVVGQMGQLGGMGQMGGMGQLGGMGQMGGMGQLGGMGQMGGMGQLGGMGQMGGMGGLQMGGLGQLGGLGQMGGLGQAGENGAVDQQGPNQFNDIFRAMGGLGINGGMGQGNNPNVVLNQNSHNQLNNYANGGMGQNGMGLNLGMGQNGGMGLNGRMRLDGGMGLLGGIGGQGGPRGQGLDGGNRQPDQRNELLQALAGMRGNRENGGNGQNSGQGNFF